jgi:3-hydroxybutyryl-CoA dehydrogenase
MKEIKQVSIMGSGLMGSGIAQMFASSGYPVMISSRDPSKSTAHANIRENMEILRDAGMCTDEDIARTLDNVKLTASQQEAAEFADIIFENLPEVMEIKQKAFKDLGEMTHDDCLICSNTSVMSITEIASQAKNKHRMMGTHWWNPPTLIPLVEVVKTADTDPAYAQAAYDVLKKIGKKPVMVEKDVPGFLANRMQHALWREAFYIVEQGIASPEAVDEAISNSFGFRLPVLAPCENSDMVGTDLTFNIHSYILKYLCDSHEPSPYLAKLVEDGKMGFKSGFGMYSKKWTDEDMKASRRKLNEYLIDANKRMKK